MSELTIAQLVARLSADTAEFDARLTKSEERMDKAAEKAEKAAQGISSSFARSAKGVDDLTKATTNAERAADNLAKYEYATGVKSASDYAEFLRERLANTEKYSTQAKTLYSQLASVEIKVARETAAEKKAIDSNYLTLFKQTNDAKIQSEQRLLEVTKFNLAEEERARQQAVASINEQLASRENAAKQAEQSAANVARFEYQTNARSADDYAFFLERRMAAYQLYSTEWKAASAELVSVQKSMAAEAQAVENQKDAAILARAKEIGAERIAVEKEVQAAMVEASKAGLAAQTKAIEDAEAVQAEARKGQAALVSGVAGAGGTAAGAITAVELGSTILSSQFDHNLIGQANNTTMTDAEIAKTKQNVLELGKETGQNLQDILTGSRWVSDFSKSTDTAAGKLNILTWANKEATASLASTQDVARSLASTMHIFGASSDKAAGYIDVLNLAAKQGGLTIEQFATNTGPALAIAAEMHDKFYIVAAALSQLTKAGFDASESATQVKSMYAHIVAPTHEARMEIEALNKAFHKLNPKTNIDLNFDFSQQGVQAKGVLQILKDIGTVTGGSATEGFKTITALRGGVGALMFEQLERNKGNDAEKEADTLKGLQLSNRGTETQSNFNRMMDDSQQKWKVFSTTLETEFIPIGERAMTVFEKWEPAISKTVNGILSLMEAFQRLPEPIQQTVTAIGGLVILEKLTGLLVALRVPVALAAGLRTAFEGFGNLAKGAAFLEGTPLAATLALWSARLGGVALAGEGVATLLAGPIGIAIGAVVLAIAGLTIAWKTDFLHIQEVTNGVWYEIKRGGVETFLVLKDVNAAWSKADDANRARILSGWTAFKAGVLSNLADMKKGFLETGPDIIKGLGLDPIVGKFDVMFSAIEARFSTFISNLGSTLSTWWDNTPAGKYLGSLSSRTDAIVGPAPTTGKGSTYNGPFDVFTSHGTSPTGAPNNLESPGELGAKAALKADAEQTDKDAHDCQHRARVAIQSASHAFDAYFSATDPITHKVTANSVSSALNSAGLLQPYSPGMALKPGDLLYSTSLGIKNNTGHVSEIDSKGSRRDQYGSNHFPEKDYQYMFDPDYAKAKLNNGQDTAPTVPVTPEQLAAQTAQEAADKKSAKEADSAAKALKDRYETETRSLKEVIALKKQSSDLDNTHEHETKTRFDVSSSGDLTGISKAQADRLVQLAKLADIADQQRKINLLIRAMSDKVMLNNQSPLKQETINSMGGLHNWQAMTPKEQKGATASQLQADREEESNANAKRLKDLAFAQSIAGDSVKRAAVEAVGGVAKWNLLTDATKTARIEAERNLEVTDASTQMLAEYNAKIDENTEAVKTNAEAVAIEIRGKALKLGVKPEDHRFDEDRKAADKADYNQANKYFTDLDSKQDASQAEFDANNKKAVDYSPKGEAIAQFDANNKEEIERVNKLVGAYKDLATAKLNASRQKYVTDTTTQYVTTTSRELDAETKKLNDKTTVNASRPSQVGMSTGDKAVEDWIVNNQKIIKALGDQSIAVTKYETALKSSGDSEDFTKGQDQMASLLDGLGKQALLLKNSNPFDIWLKGFYTLQQVTGADGKKTLSYMLPSGMDVTNMQQIYNLQVKMAQQAKVASMLQEVAGGATDAIMAGVNAAFAPDPSKTGSLQTQLLQQQQEQQQYEVAEAEFKNQYPNDPNDPYTTRLQDLQKAINDTNSKLQSMGSNIGQTFKRMFDAMAQSFEQTLTKMAQSYLQSQLLQYISKQVGTGQGPMTGGSSGGILGSIVQGISGILGGGGGAASAVSNATSDAVSVATDAASSASFALTGGASITMLGDGGDYNAGQPFWAGERGQKELIVPSVNGTVIPSSKIRQSGGATSTVVNNNTNVHMPITTPDVQGFRSSRATIIQQIGKGMMTKKR